MVSGVNIDKWSLRKRVSPLARSKLNIDSSEVDLLKRESVYNALRAELHSEFM